MFEFKSIIYIYLNIYINVYNLNVEVFCSTMLFDKNLGIMAIMFISRTFLSFEAYRFWFAASQGHLYKFAQITLEGDKSKSKGLKWQQYPSKWTLLDIFKKHRRDCEHPKNAQFDIYVITSNFFNKLWWDFF